MPDIESMQTIMTRQATGEGKNDQPDRKQINTVVTDSDFIKVKTEALRQGVSIAAVVRQLIDLL